MKETIYLITLIVIVFTSACHPEAGVGESLKVEIQESKPINPSMHSDRIRNATLLIRIESIQPDGVFLGYEMATLVQYQGATYLVTHNHYGEMLQDTNIVQFRDAQNHKIQSMYGSEFKSLIVYQDPGTLVLRAPDGLTDALTPVSLDYQPQLQPGDIVQVAYRGGSKRQQVNIVDAVVEEITVSGVTPVYRLRSLDGQLLSAGDSGGGVWYEGSLVGNTWSIVLTYAVEATSATTDTIEPASMTQTNLSNAAIFPEIFP
jgi:hypothetical protein